MRNDMYNLFDPINEKEFETDSTKFFRITGRRILISI